MNISTITRKFGLVFAAGVLAVSLVAPMTALASEDGYDYYGGDYSYDTTDYYGGDYDYGATDYYGGDYDYDTTDYYGGDYDYGSTDYYGGDYNSDTTDYYGGDYSYDTADYGTSYDSGYSAPSFGGSSYGSGYSYSMPTFGSANYGYRQTYFPQYTTPSNTVVNTETNTCTDNSCNSSYVDNSIVDNSVKISNSYNNQKKQDHGNDCDNGYNYGNQYGYGQQGYNYGSYNYQGNCYSYAAPITFPVNTTPYITLSQAPYTGLDLGPFGEVLYWAFLVLWCLGAAYLVVVKRVQNKLVSFLNGFLFGSSAKTAVHAAHAPKAAAASAPLVEDGIDPFIKSQIKRA